jgi:hypothetical protein
MNKKYPLAFTVLIPFLLIAGPSIDAKAAPKDKPKPVTVITKEEIDAVIVKQWAPTNKEIFKKTSLSARELRSVLGNFAIRRIIADMSKKPEISGGCKTINLLDIKVIPSLEEDGTINEIWETEQCSEPKALPISMSPALRDEVKESAVGLPIGFMDDAK